ncbi:MATE family efflux transporter [Pseudogemmatithrix spongiicola]|uniref:Multidrug-efflux transporter n=1 Tax=Pseudogemmatithrix spongiicola TaxID=3062599 RepID=A0AA49Q537_9BACT|nr:MATE family efflux transporter [Gemmatimonadaceae bacterium 'strain 138']WKW15251.1 MATE family efflux transporter [Gemmatimonadaceae bacterium 'strain 318']
MKLAALRPTKSELVEMAKLALPIVLVNVGMQGQGLVDAIMLGRVSSVDLAAGGLGNFYFFGVAIIGIGILMALDPVIAQGVGAKDEAQIARGVQRGVLMTVIVAVAVSLLFLLARPVLSLLRQPPEVVPLAAAYVLWSIPGMLPFFAFNMLRQTLQAFHRVGPVVWGVVVGNVVNAFLNWVLIYGNLGFEARGVVGSSIATSISRWVMALVVLVGAWPTLRPYLTRWYPESTLPAPLLRMFRLGLPVGLQFLAEAGAFGLTTVMTGWMGTTVLAGHEIALSLASMTFMVPMGVAAAAAVMVGHAIGRGDVAASRRDAVAALVVGVGFMALCAIAFALVPESLAGLYSRDAATFALAATLIPVAAVFQVFDGTQVISASILRGAGDTRVPAILHGLSFWAVGIPLGALIAFRFDQGAIGLWWGLTAGLAAAAVLQLRRVRVKLGREVERLVLEH